MPAGGFEDSSEKKIWREYRLVNGLAMEHKFLMRNFDVTQKKV